MTNKEALFFVGKCLSLSVHPERASDIKSLIQTGSVDWKLVVYQSSSQFVLPALYLNLQRNDLLSDLPEDLIEHFDKITCLNRERNESILQQLKAITNLLNENGIKPVFLKGTAHLLDGLYEDIGERMIGDIDFLLEEKEALQAYNLLLSIGYKPVLKNAQGVFGKGQHLPRLYKGNDAAVEVHRRMLNKKPNRFFNWELVKDRIKESYSNRGFFVLSGADQLLHNMMNAQIKDKGHRYFLIFLRNSYDLLLLSKHENALKISQNFGYYFNTFNNYIALSSRFFDTPKNLDFKKTISLRFHFWMIDFFWKAPFLYQVYRISDYFFFRFVRYITLVVLFFINKRERKRVLAIFQDRDHLKRHFDGYKKLF